MANVSQLKGGFNVSDITFWHLTQKKLRKCPAILWDEREMSQLRGGNSPLIIWGTHSMMYA